MESSAQGAPNASAPLDFRKIWEEALTFEQFVAQARPEHQALWQGIYRHAMSPDWAAELLDGDQELDGGHAQLRDEFCGLQ